MELLNKRGTYRDGAGGVTVWIVRPALIIPLIPGPEVLDEKHHPSCLLVVPRLLPLPLPALGLLQGEPPPGPLDSGGGQPSHSALVTEWSILIGRDRRDTVI